MVSMRSLFAYFWRDQPRVICFVLCCAAVLLLAWWKRDALAVQLKNKIVLPAALLLVVFGNPVSARILVTQAEETQSLRFFWLIPVSLFLAVAAVLLLDRLPRRWLKGVAAAAIVPVVLLGSRQFTALRANWQNDTPNWYKIPQVVVDLCDYILEDDTYTENRAAFVFPLNLWVRQYDSDIFLLFCWAGGENLDLRDAMEMEEGEIVNLNRISYLAAEDDCQYLVIPAEGRYVGSLEKYGYTQVYAARGSLGEEVDDYDKEYLLYRLEKGAADDH